jgi:hypothetical protein
MCRTAQPAHAKLFLDSSSQHVMLR